MTVMPVTGGAINMMEYLLQGNLSLYHQMFISQWSNFRAPMKLLTVTCYIFKVTIWPNRTNLTVVGAGASNGLHVNNRFCFNC